MASEKVRRTRGQRLTPPTSTTRLGLMPGLTNSNTFSQTASKSPARIRRRSSPLLARCVMSVLRITGQRPDKAAGCVSSAQSCPASATDREKRSTSCLRKLPVPCEQRLFSRKVLSPSRNSKTEKPWLPMFTTVAGPPPKRNR